jgi:hypothetical protein
MDFLGVVVIYGKSGMLALRALGGILPAWVGRTIILLGALAVAGLTAALLGMLAHETLGISRSEIRADALGSAVLLAIVWGASYFREPRQ